MKFTIIKDDNMVGVDGLFLEIDCSSLPANLHAVQWYDTEGEVEYKDGPNTTINSLTEYQSFVDDWNTLNHTLTQRETDPTYGLTGSELAEAQKQVSINGIIDTFNTAVLAPVTVTVTDGTFDFVGGEESAMKINNAIALSEQLNETELYVTDVNREARLLTIADAKIVASEIGLVFRSAFYTKQAALLALE